MTALKAAFPAGSAVQDALHIMGNMLSYLATGSIPNLTLAVNAALAGAGAGTAVTLYGRTAPFVFDWGFADLTPTQKTNLISIIETQNAASFNLGPNGALAGCGNEQGYVAFALGAIAVYGEPGTVDYSLNLRNMVQNVTQWCDEVMADGQWTGYQYEITNFFCGAFLAYHIAGVGTEALIPSRFSYGLNRPKYLAYKCANNGYTMMSVPSNHKAIGVTTQAGPNIDGACPSGVFVPEFACHNIMYADIYRSGLAQTAALNCVNNSATQKWSDGNASMNSQPCWLAFIFYDQTLTPVAYSTLPTSEIFSLPGLVSFRGGWTQVNDVKGWVYSPPFQLQNHDGLYAGAIEITRGDDQLICTQYTYAGAPSAWQAVPQTATEVGTHSMCKPTVLFSPTGSATPDRSGSQTGQRDPASATAYPISTRFAGTNGANLCGTVGAFTRNGSSPSAKAQATATYGSAFYPNTTVTAAGRTVAYVNGPDNAHGTFFIQDLFTTVASSVDRIRAFFGMRQKPIGMTSETVVTGISAAGVMTYPNQKVTIRWRNSQAIIQMVSPAPVLLRLVGGGNSLNGAPAGPGYESYFDGSNLDYFVNAQSGKNAAQYARIQGTWHLECETTPAAAGGQMLFAITVGDIGDVAPTYTQAQVLAILSGAGSAPTMPGLTQSAQRSTLDTIFGSTRYLALFTTQPGDDGTGGVEVSGTNYARLTTLSSDWAAAAGGSPATKANSTARTYAQAGSIWGASVVGWGFFDASTAGTLVWADYMGNFAWAPFTCSLASPGVITSPAHGLSNGDLIAVTTKYGGTLPTTVGSWGGLLTVANATASTFTAGVNTTSIGDGQFRKVAPAAIGNGDQFSFAVGALIASLG